MTHDYDIENVKKFGDGINLLKKDNSPKDILNQEMRETTEYFRNLDKYNKEFEEYLRLLQPDSPDSLHHIKQMIPHPPEHESILDTLIAMHIATTYGKVNTTTGLN
ncbi:hypothetical protein [Vibrio phage vB_VhaP_PG11]|nr:hypothetical protein [Vibrio phage vB_VhaP_PG11]